MTMLNIPYKSFCWVIGTTSFRTSKLNFKIEKQLLLLHKFHNKVNEKNMWTWNRKTQEDYYDFMKQNEFVLGSAARKDKDAREKTSGLVDLGLLYDNRTLTAVGKHLLEIAQNGNFKSQNIFEISEDSFIYLKQLLKTSIKVGTEVVRPFIVTIKCLCDLKFLTFDEFTYIVPLISTKESYPKYVELISKYRRGEIELEDIIYRHLMGMDNYQIAYKEFLKRTKVDSDLICTIGMNRKSKKYDETYFPLYQELKELFLEDGSNAQRLFEAVKKVRQKPGALWKKMLFGKNTARQVKKLNKEAIDVDCPFRKCLTEDQLKITFFRYMHVFKAVATLSDYFDLNRRYFNIADIILFENQKIQLDILPKYYFMDSSAALDEIAFQDSDCLNTDVPLEDISFVFKKDMQKVYSKINEELGTQVKTVDDMKEYINDERYQRFNSMIDHRFNNDILLELLECFECRNDKRIEELVTDEATIPTIFEYVLGIIWYKVSNRRGKILDFMKLSLEANLLPKTHAAGGFADIVYEYKASAEYPAHSLLLEATLSEDSNQRRMEMEPVSL